MNPMIALQAILKSNPQLKETYSRVEQMTQGKSVDEMKQIAVNLCNQRGTNLEQAMAMFQKQFPGMGGMNR